jgi:hypothetical protein
MSGEGERYKNSVEWTQRTPGILEEAFLARSGLSSEYRYGDEKTGLVPAAGWMGRGIARSAGKLC